MTMRTLLDLIQEFAVLNEAKTLARGVLPPDDERRWQELKRFYDLLMSQRGYCDKPASRFTPAQIREKVSARFRLRVTTDMEIIVESYSFFMSAQVGNLSCGGALLLSDTSLEIGTRVTLHLTDITRIDGVLPTRGEVVWQADQGVALGRRRYRVGVRFTDLENEIRTRLDGFVVEALESQILSLPTHMLDSKFIHKEKLILL
jgi:hypothetical protein